MKHAALQVALKDSKAAAEFYKSHYNSLSHKQALLTGEIKAKDMVIQELRSREKDDRVTGHSVWLNVWLKVAASDNCADKRTPAKWADECLKGFKERFPEAIREGNKGDEK